jgi:FkbM family methyltransferase
VRSTVVRAARRVGLEPELRLGQALLGSRSQRRNRLDDLRLLRLIRSLPPQANYVDVGANRGHILRWFATSAPSGQHIAFEPLPDLAARLRHEFPDVTVHAVALSDRAGTATFYRAEEDTRSGLCEAPPARASTVTTGRLDDLLPDDYVPHLIKVDVEGAEGLVFRGAVRTLERWRPIVAFEHGDAALRFGFTHADIYDLLSGYELAIFDMRGTGPLSREEFEAADVWNFVAASTENVERVRRLRSRRLRG